MLSSSAVRTQVVFVSARWSSSQPRRLQRRHWQRAAINLQARYPSIIDCLYYLNADASPLNLINPSCSYLETLILYFSFICLDVFPMYLRVAPHVVNAMDELIADRSFNESHRHILLQSKEYMVALVAAQKLDESQEMPRVESAISLTALRILYQHHPGLKASPGGLTEVLRGSKLFFPGGPL